jgi:hypothetical protein
VILSVGSGSESQLTGLGSPVRKSLITAGRGRRLL